MKIRKIATTGKVISGVIVSMMLCITAQAQVYDYTPPSYNPQNYNTSTPSRSSGYSYNSPAYYPSSDYSSTYSPPAYVPPTYTTPAYTPPTYYTPSYYNATCKADSFSLETDETVLKDMFKNKKCIALDYDEIPNFDAYHISDCYYKHYGVSCSSVNEDCDYVDTSMLDCDRYDGECEIISEYWNRPMKVGAIPITYSSIDTARDVVIEYADQEHTSIKAVKDKYTFRHNDKEMWWREVYYLCTQGNIADRSYYFNKKKLVSQEAGEEWIRGEVGHKCKCEARLGYYFYQGDQEYEAEWTLPDAAPEKWRKVD